MSAVVDGGFEFDVRRSILLGGFIKHWGMPEWRVVARKGDEAIEVYLFPGANTEKVARIATVGLSSSRREGEGVADYELLFVLPRDLCGCGFDAVAAFVLDVAAYSLSRGVSFDVGSVVPETRLAPVQWSARALLVDEPRGEQEEIAVFHVGAQHVELRWVVPIYASELQAILANGVGEFDRACESVGCSLSNPCRDSVL